MNEEGAPRGAFRKIDREGKRKGGCVDVVKERCMRGLATEKKS